jgi:hypothetical protein
MTASAHIYLTLVRKALDLAGEELRGQRIIGEIMIHGRSAIFVRYSWYVPKVAGGSSLCGNVFIC